MHKTASKLTRSVEHMYVSVVIMSKSCCFALVWAAISLPVILLSLEAVDAQPTIDETMTCSASTLEEVVNMVKIVASNQQRNAQEIKEEITDKVRDVKNTIASSCEHTNETSRVEDIVREIKDEIRLLVTNPIKIELAALEPSKQALVSALVCEYSLVLLLLVSRYYDYYPVLFQTRHRKGSLIDLRVDCHIAE